MTRLTGQRIKKDEEGNNVEGYHDYLFDLQYEFVEQHTSFFELQRELYEKHFRFYLGYIEEARLHHADPHPKRLLRINAWQELHDNNDIGGNGTWLKSAHWKMKTNEIAKQGKFPRMIVDLGCPASLLGFRITEFLKTAQFLEPIHINGGTMEFCKSPDPIFLKQAFAKLVNPPGRFYFLYFSDDSCLSIRTSNNTVHYYNLDISSCDASHGPSVFRSLLAICPPHFKTELKKLIDQCKSVLRIEDLADKRRVILMKPKWWKLYSGVTPTTLINNEANIMICLSITERAYEGPHDIEQGAERVGYIVTGCVPLSCPEDIQFLKNSPMLTDDGEYESVLNLGVLIRASGACDGDLPGRDDIKERACRFQRGLLLGAYPKAHFQILDRMWESVGKGEHYESKYFKQKVVDVSEQRHFYVTRTSFMNRYRLSDEEYQGLLDFADCKYGEVVNNEGVSKVLRLDYGLSCCSRDDTTGGVALG